MGGKEFYAARLAKAELANRQSRLIEEADRIMQGVDADFALLQSATLRIATAQAEQDAALLVLQSVQQQMKTGRVGSMLEALDANERYFSSRQRLVQTLTQHMQAHAQLLRRLGMLSQVQSMVNQPTDINSSMSMVKKAVSVEPTRPSDKDARPQATPAMTDLPTQAVNQGPATEIMLPPAQPLDVKELNNMLEPNPNTGNSSP